MMAAATWHATGPRTASFLVALAGAAAVMALSVAAHWQRACEVHDTPYLPICPAGADGKTAPSLQEASDKLGRNPGDSSAWMDLLQAQADMPSDALLKASAAVAPNDVNVQRWQAARALQEDRLAEGVAGLVRILEYRSGAKEAQILAALIARGDGAALLAPHLATAKAWLPPVIAAMGTLKVPAGLALTLVAQAIAQDALPPESRQAYMRALKRDGQWLDAYGLWMAQHKQAPLLYNASFDDAFEPDGFDWEFSPVVRSRSGFFLQQETIARRGHVLDVEFTGRAFPNPVLWQYVFLPPGTYTLHGEYSASSFRSENGLAWSVQCLQGSKAIVGRSPALQDSGGVWKPFELGFTVPPECGPVARLQLGPAAGYEALTGMRGRVAFDNFGLSRAIGP